MNSDEQVTARENEESSVGVVLQLASASGSAQQAAQVGMTKAGFREASGERTDINGLPAYVGLYDGVMNNTRVRVRAAHIQAGGRVYLVAGVAPATQFNRADAAFQDSINSFRTLSRAEGERIQPNRVDFYVVRPGDTWESIAKGAGNATIRAATLAIMNGRDATTQPKAGERIRIVVSNN